MARCARSASGDLRVNLGPRATSDDRTGTRVPPPVIYAAGFVLGWALDAWVGLSSGARLPLMGGAIVLLGAALGAWALLAFRRARTTWHPHGGTTAIVAEGPYEFTRNPMYVALTLGYVGFAFIVGSLGALLTLPGVLLWMSGRVIAREETYLRRKFGPAYEQYARRVRRWF